MDRIRPQRFIPSFKARPPSPVHALGVVDDHKPASSSPPLRASGYRNRKLAPGEVVHGFHDSNLGVSSHECQPCAWTPGSTRPASTLAFCTQNNKKTLPRLTSLYLYLYFSFRPPLSLLQCGNVNPTDKTVAKELVAADPGRKRVLVVQYAWDSNAYPGNSTTGLSSSEQGLSSECFSIVYD